MMSGKEKIYFLLGCIQDLRVTSPSGQTLKIDRMNDLYGNYEKEELSRLFTKLEQDEHILKILKIPSGTKTIDFVEGLDPYEQIPEQDDGLWHIELIQPVFDEYLLKTQEEPEYKEFSSKKLLPTQTQAKNELKPDKKAIEKIWNVLQEIEEKRQLGNNESIRISCLRNDSTGEHFEERKTIVGKLSSLQAIKELHKVRVSRNEGKHYFWSFLLDKNYQKVFEDYEKLYKEIASKYEQTKKMQEVILKNPVYEVKYSEQTREILINGFLLKKLRSFSDNDATFAYLYKNPNKDKSSEDIKNATKMESVKDLNKFLDDIGFTGELRRVFFKVSKSRIQFNNPITKEYLEEIGIERLKLE